jgi:hypothetical protein
MHTKRLKYSCQEIGVQRACERGQKNVEIPKNEELCLQLHHQRGGFDDVGVVVIQGCISSCQRVVWI